MKRDRASELRAIADGRLMLNVRNGVTVSRSMLAMIADEIDAERAAHAETKRERDELFELVEDYRKREMLTNDRLAEALKALEEIGNGCDGRVDKDALPCRIARRVREGGKS